MSDWMVKGDALDKYLAACKEAATNDYAYKTFMNSPPIKKIFCHTTNEILSSYAEKIKGVFYSDEKYAVQYYSIMLDLHAIFGSLDGLKICEIGGGYGGQAAIICSQFTPACYHIIDLHEVTMLQNRYLRDKVLNTIPKTFTEPIGTTYDLVISNYAYSEILEPTKSIYCNEILRKSKMGYITWNTVPDLDWEYEIYPDIEGEAKDNCITIWKTK